MKTRVFFSLAVVVLCGTPGCSPTSKEITSLQRKEAATLDSEAQFALQLKDLARAEGLLVKAAELCPDTGKYWVDLGSIRVRLGKKDAARTAYQGALQAYEGAAANAKAGAAPDPGPWLQQVYVLALLGRVDDARSVLAKAQKKFPESRAVRSFVEGKQIDKMIADPSFKLIAL
jgi:Flp pilus assembly protein TadD